MEVNTNCHICLKQLSCSVDSSFVFSSQSANIFKKYLVERSIIPINPFVPHEDTEVRVCLICNPIIKKLLNLHSTIEEIRQQIQNLLDVYIDENFEGLSPFVIGVSEIKKDEVFESFIIPEAKSVESEDYDSAKGVNDSLPDLYHKSSPIFQNSYSSPEIQSPSWKWDEDEPIYDTCEQDPLAESGKESTNNPEACYIIRDIRVKLERLPEVSANKTGYSVNSKLTPKSDRNVRSAEASIGIYTEEASTDSDDDDKKPTTSIIQKEHSDYFVMFHPQTGETTIKCKCCDNLFETPKLYFKHREVNIAEESADDDETVADKYGSEERTEGGETVADKHGSEERTDEDETVADLDCEVHAVIANSQLNSNNNMLPSNPTLKTHIKKILHGDGQFECRKCPKVFKLKNSLERHLKIKHNIVRKQKEGEGLFKCSVCSRRVKTFGGLIEHQKTKHNYKKRYECFCCAMTFVEKNSRDSHFTEAHVEDSFIKCPHCALTYRTLWSLQAHVKEKHVECSKNGAEEGIFFCSKCGEVCKTKPLLKLHQKEVHDIDAVQRKRKRISKCKHDFTCKTCGRGYKTEFRLETHQLTHNVGELPHKCYFCAMTFKTNRNLHEHHLTHKDEKAFLCSTCKMHFKNSADLIAHQLSEEHIGSKPPYKCSSCPMEYEKKDDILNHLQSHKGDKDFLCSVCGKGFDFYRYLQKHSVAHNEERPYKCSSCPRAFKTYHSLICHMESIHLPKQLYKCPQCTQILSSRGYLRAHIVAKHLNRERLKCSSCTLTFSTRAGLRGHTNRVHLRIKPHHCTHCGMRFTGKTSLTQHIRTHTGEKPYLCHTCGKRFGSSEHLKIHEIIHTGEKPFKCPHCAYACAQRNNMYKHMKKQHAAQRSKKFNYNQWLYTSK